jgi:hypothetical protein
MLLLYCLNITDFSLCPRKDVKILTINLSLSVACLQGPVLFKMFVADKNAAVLQSGRIKVNRGSFILLSRVTGTGTLLLTVEVPYYINNHCSEESIAFPSLCTCAVINRSKIGSK